MKGRDSRSEFVSQYIGTVSEALRALSREQLSQAIGMLEKAYLKRKNVFLIGNGGSAATASHMANDLMMGVAKSGKPGFRTFALADHTPAVTAIANDDGYQHIFSSQLSELAAKQDFLIVISGSGNSPNILEALKVAKKIGMRTIGFLGMGGGKAKKMLDCAVIVDANEYGFVEDVHMVFDHLITKYFYHWVDRP